MQIYVEIERARLTKQLAGIQEQDGDVGAAADTLQEVAVVSLRLASKIGTRRSQHDQAVGSVCPLDARLSCVRRQLANACLSGPQF